MEIKGMDIVSILLGVCFSVIGFVVVFIIKDVFWKKSVSNQDKIDSAIDAKLKEHGDKIIALEKIALTHDNSIKNSQGDIANLENRQKEIDSVAREINNNMKLFILNQENTNKVIVDNTKNMHESTAMMKEFLNEFKRMKQ